MALGWGNYGSIIRWAVVISVQNYGLHYCKLVNMVNKQYNICLTLQLTISATEYTIFFFTAILNVNISSIPVPHLEIILFSKTMTVTFSKLANNIFCGHPLFIWNVG